MTPPPPPPTCAKCKQVRAVAVGNQTEFLCGQCLRNSLVAKFKSAVNQHKLVQRGDRVLLAFSGGHASRSALNFLASTQAPSLSFEKQGQAARGRIPFSLGVAFVDERAITGLVDAAADSLAADIRGIVADHGLPFHEARLESILHDPELADAHRAVSDAAAAELGGRHEGTVSRAAAADLADVRQRPVSSAAGADLADGHERAVSSAAAAELADAPDGPQAIGSDRVALGLPAAPDGSVASGILAERLARLVTLAGDSTGMEDLVSILRLELLQQIALLGRYNRLVLATTTSRIAALALASISKGVGFSLPADIQLFDARWSVPVIRPIRDCAAEELAVLCHLEGLKTVFVPNIATSPVFPRSGAATRRALPLAASKSASINRLTAKFAAAVQRENQSRQNTIVRTALKLHPFAFNQDPAAQALLVERDPSAKAVQVEGDNRGQADIEPGPSYEASPGDGCITMEPPPESAALLTGPGSRKVPGTTPTSPAQPTRGVAEVEGMVDVEEDGGRTCVLCMAPLPLRQGEAALPPTFRAAASEEGEVTRLENGEADGADTAVRLRAGCCRSCVSGILPPDNEKLMQFVDLLPAVIRERVAFSGRNA